MNPMDHPLFGLIAPIVLAGAIIATTQFFLTGKNLLALFKKLRSNRSPIATPVVVAASAPATSTVTTPITGPIFFDGLWYGSIEKAAGYLGLAPATIESAVRPDVSAQADAFWKDTGPSVALSHRVLKVGKTRSRVFVRDYPGHQTAYVRRKDGRYPIHGRFSRGPKGDEAILRLASAI